LREHGLPPAEEAGRGSGAPAPGEDRREADEADPGPGRLSGRAGRRPVQAGALPLLSRVPGQGCKKERAPRGARSGSSAAKPQACCASAEPGMERCPVVGGGPVTGADNGGMVAGAGISEVEAGGTAVFIAIERIASDTARSGTRSDRRRKVSRLS